MWLDEQQTLTASRVQPEALEGAVSGRLVAGDGPRARRCAGGHPADRGQLELDVPRDGTVAQTGYRGWLARPAERASAAESEVAWLDAAALDRHEPASDGPWLAAGLSADGTALRLRFKTPPVERTSVRALLAAWHEVVQAFASDSTAPLAEVGLLSPSERQRQHALLADGPWSHVGSLSVTDCFAVIVQSHRDRVALAWGGGRMSYGELDEASGISPWPWLQRGEGW